MAPLFTWNDSYSVKVALCDAQHKRLFAIINELADAMRMGKGQDVVSTTVKELLDYTRSHFNAEEGLLKKTNYPQLGPHQELHRKFVAEVETLEKQTREGKLADPVRMLAMLRDWLVNHIQKTDQQYSGHLNAAGIR
jgi:hemerythrin